MAHPQHNFTSNFNGSEGHNAELTLNINGVEKKYTPAGNDQTYDVPGVARIDSNLDGAELVQAIQTALDVAAQPLLVESSGPDEETIYQYIGEVGGRWCFGLCTTTKIATIIVAKADGAVTREQIPIANGVVIVQSNSSNVYTQLRTAIGLGQLPVLSYVGANPVYAQYEKTADNGDLIFVGALATQSTSSRVQFTIYTVASDNTITTTSCESFSGNYDDLDNTPILVAKYGSTTYAQVWQFAFYAGKTAVCTKQTLTAVLIDEDGYSFTFATPPNAKGQYHVFTVHDDNSWTDQIIERTHDLICQLKPIVVAGSTVMRYILCDRQRYTIENGATVFQPVDVFDLATWINHGDVIQIDGAAAHDPWGDRYPMQIIEAQCVTDSGTGKQYCSNIEVWGYAYSATAITRWGDVITDEATNTKYLEFQTWT